jgi:hypothetical protein
MSALPPVFVVKNRFEMNIFSALENPQPVEVLWHDRSAD